MLCRANTGGEALGEADPSIEAAARVRRTMRNA
jgi:hypothetical protein